MPTSQASRSRHGWRDQQVMIAGCAKHVGFYPTPAVIEMVKYRLAQLVGE